MPRLQCPGWLPAAAAAAAAGTSPAVAGSAYFENGTFARPHPATGSFAVMDSGERYGVWKVVGAQGTVTWVSKDYTHRGFSFVAPPRMIAWVNLAGTSQTTTGLSHAPIATVVGATYSVTLFVGNLVDPAGVYGNTSTVNVYQNSHLVGAATNSGGTGSTSENWKKFSMSFKATEPYTVIAVINGDPPGDGNCGIGDINVMPADEASRAALAPAVRSEP